MHSFSPFAALGHGYTMNLTDSSLDNPFDDTSFNPASSIEVRRLRGGWGQSQFFPVDLDSSEKDYLAHSPRASQSSSHHNIRWQPPPAGKPTCCLLRPCVPDHQLDKPSCWIQRAAVKPRVSLDHPRPNKQISCRANQRFSDP